MLEIVAMERAVSLDTYKFILETWDQSIADQLLYDPRELDDRYID